jgi:2-polyprenyl-3-methyl-5-hydroxy-6-metoxy-1,4-benzoquinol methylase
MTIEDQTKEQQYQVMLNYRDSKGLESFGLMSSQAWYDDPKRLAFTLSRYKFAAKILAGSKNVLEIGCADAFATRVVAQEVEKLTAIDFDPLFIEDAKARMSDRWKFECFVHDMLSGPVLGKYDGIYSLDVLEHILPEHEALFLNNMIESLDVHGAMVIGMPSLESQPYASPMSKEGHVNCKSMPDFKKTMQHYFHNVFMFSMNDEVVHTGYHKMAHYLFAVCCGKKDQLD